MAKLEILPKKFDVLDANDKACSFRINIDVLNEAFGVKRAMYAKACYPDKKNGFFTGNKEGDLFKIWMPKLYGNSSEWKNSISDDATEIYEIAEENRTEDWTEIDDSIVGNLRIVFVKPSKKEPYQFVGVFKDQQMDHLKHTYTRIASKIKLIGDPVNKIELLDDNR